MFRPRQRVAVLSGHLGEARGAVVGEDARERAFGSEEALGASPLQHATHVLALFKGVLGRVVSKFAVSVGDPAAKVMRNNKKKKKKKKKIQRISRTKTSKRA